MRAMESKLIIVVVLLVIDWSGNNGCFGRRLSDDTAATALREIEEEFDCNQLKGKFDHNTTKMLAICENIMNSELVRKTKEYIQTLTKVRRGDGIHKVFTKLQKSVSRKRRAADGCPIFTQDYLEKHKGDVGRRSLSPYVSEIDFDLKRFPRVILESKCSCSGCINPTTGRQSMAYSSVPVEVEQSVFYQNSVDGTYDVSTRKFTVACTCVAHPLLYASLLNN